MQRGIIVSIQGYSKLWTEETAHESINAGAVALRLDKHISGIYTIIGLNKIRKVDRQKTAYITPDVESIKQIEDWSNYIAVDFRTLNPDLAELNKYCEEKDIGIIADIANIKDYENILRNNYSVDYVATTLSVLYNHGKPSLGLITEIKKLNRKVKVIAEGNYKYPRDVYNAFNIGAHNVCIGTAITNIFKKTKMFTRLVR